MNTIAVAFHHHGPEPLVVRKSWADQLSTGPRISIRIGGDEGFDCYLSPDALRSLVAGLSALMVDSEVLALSIPLEPALMTEQSEEVPF